MTAWATRAMPSGSSVLYNFRLLAALRSDDPSQLHTFLDDEGHAQTGALLGMAVKAGTSEYRVHLS